METRSDTHRNSLTNAGTEQYNTYEVDVETESDTERDKQEGCRIL